MKRLLLIMMSVLSAGLSGAQPGGFQVIKSPVVNPDNTVTFNYRNDNAKKVSVDVQFAGAHEMVKGEDGVWTITLGPAAPDIYPYKFVVDGVSVMDPMNPDWFPNEGFKNSLLDIPGNGAPLIHAPKNVPHGSVDYVNYYSETLGLYGNAIVYTPPFYDKNTDRKYPVMYLISGTTDTEEVYYKVGKVNLILDNLIAEGAAKEMIVVLPYGNPSKLFPAGKRYDFRKGDPFSGDLLNDLMPFVEKNYRTINDRQSRAIGGFSRGGNQALAIGLSHLDKFSWLCSYSSFTSTTIPEVYDNAEKTNSLVNLFWLGVGTDDFLYGNAKDYMDFLDAKGIRNMKVFTDDKFGHTWMNAKYFLDKSLRLLFTDKPYEGYVPVSATVKPAENQVFNAEVSRRLFPMGVRSPEYNADGSVTFRFLGPDAAKVELECQMFQGHKEMTKDEKGVWSITVTPDAPDIYPYCFFVDGTQVADPENMYIFPNENFKNSLADVRGAEPSVQDIRDVPHGKISYRLYHSDVLGAERPLVVYTPAGYDPAGSEKLPVLYLMHGMTDTQETWFKVGRVNNIMDNLIAAGEAERMIVAMPYANVGGMMETKGFVDEILKSVVPYVEANFNVIADPAHRAIAGFSLGGRQTLACGLGNPDKFNWVAAYAPAIFGEEYKASFANGTYAPLDVVKSNLKMFWLGTGKDDFLIDASRSLDAYLTENGLEHTFYSPAGGHTWMNCRDYIELTAKKLFR
ncbi:MAG: hypothetical protein J6W59_07430 [Bacteroidales bacterium]|nr:hypothetical protein [Bacteroidales bacterium]